MTKTAPQPEAIPLVLEDVAYLVDASDEVPGDTAVRLQAFIRCDGLEQVELTWRLIAAHRENLRQMAEDAGVESRVDGVFIFRLFERLRSQAWEQPEDVLARGVEIPYQPLIAMVSARAERAEANEKAELERLNERLQAAWRTRQPTRKRRLEGGASPCR